MNEKLLNDNTAPAETAPAPMFDLESELVILGSLIYGGGIQETAFAHIDKAKLTADDFYHSDSRAIFIAIIELRNNAQEANTNAVRLWLKEKHLTPVNGRGWATLLSKLTDHAVSGYIAAECKRIKKLAKQRRTVEKLAQATNAARIGDMDAVTSLTKQATDDAAGDHRPRGELISIDQIPIEKLEWLWDYRIPLGEITVFCGKAGSGKSTLTADIAARISNGRGFVDVDGAGYSKLATAGDVILLSAEDKVGKTLRPRLLAAGADLTRLHILRMAKDYFYLHDLDTLKNAVAVLQQTKPNFNLRLVIIDPFNSYIGGKVDVYRNNEVRAQLRPIDDWAQATNTAIIIVAHPRKMGSNDIAQMVSGSSALVELSRAVWVIGKHKDDELENTETPRRIFAYEKANYVPPHLKRSYAFNLIDHDGFAKVEWESETIQQSANQLINTHGAGERGRPDDKRNEAERFLTEMFFDDASGKVFTHSDGDFNYKAIRYLDIKAIAENTEFSMSTLKRAKKELGITSKSIAKYDCWLLVDNPDYYPDSEPPPTP